MGSQRVGYDLVTEQQQQQNFKWFLKKVRIVKAMVFPVVMHGCENWTIKKAEHQRIHVFKLWCWRVLLKVPWTARRSNQLILKDINPEYSLEGLMLKLKLQYFGNLIWRAIGKDPDAGKKPYEKPLEKIFMLGKIEGRRRRGRQKMRCWMASLTQWKWD